MERTQPVDKARRKLVYITPALHRKIRIIAAERDQYINDVMEEVATAGLSLIESRPSEPSPSSN